MIVRRSSRRIHIGPVPIGGGAPIAVQSMTCTDTRDVQATVAQIKDLEAVGCEIIRFAVPNRAAALALPAIKQAIRIPLVADIHFDYRLALLALEGGADALRLNPGNIRHQEHVQAVVSAAKERSVPIRIGVNAGSLPPPESPQEAAKSVSERMVDLALGQVRLLESLGFDLIKVSLKAFDVPTTIEAYRLIADRIPYPLHLGITEAGTPSAGIIRSAVGIGTLLYLGIGDTLRVSLTADPREEVRVGWEILKSLGLRQRGVVLVSCPTCGRTETDVISLANEVERRLQGVTEPIKVAVMGCVVNGPGEARDADVGLAAGRGRGAIFREGQVVRTVAEAEYLTALLEEVEKVRRERASRSMASD